MDARFPPAGYCRDDMRRIIAGVPKESAFRFLSGLAVSAIAMIIETESGAFDGRTRGEALQSLLPVDDMLTRAMHTFLTRPH